MTFQLLVLSKYQQLLPVAVVADCSGTCHDYYCDAGIDYDSSYYNFYVAHPVLLIDNLENLYLVVNDYQKTVLCVGRRLQRRNRMKNISIFHLFSINFIFYYYFRIFLLFLFLYSYFIFGSNP